MVLDVQKPSDPDGLTLEAWSQGFMTGGLVIMACITVANMRRKVLLHKLILIELIFGLFQGTFIFTNPPVYGWYIGVGAIFLNSSWTMHNVIAWIKNKPFLRPRVSKFYIITVILVQPYWVLEITANFLYFNNKNDLFRYTRPYEALFRDPWWIFTCCNLFWNIKRRYDFGVIELCRVSPRFAILLAAMCTSIIFVIMDILSVTHALGGASPDGINPWWKLAFIFKCLTDTVILDDFKTALDRLKRYRLKRLTSSSNTLDCSWDPGSAKLESQPSGSMPSSEHHEVQRVDSQWAGSLSDAENGNIRRKDWADLHLDLVLPSPDASKVRSNPYI